GSAIAEYDPAAIETLLRPLCGHVIIGVEDRRRVRQRYPGHLGARVDMHVRNDVMRLVEGPDADKTEQTPAAVVAPQGGLAARAPIDVMGAATGSGHLDRHGRGRLDLDPVGLDQRVDDEGTPGLALAFEAMAAMNEHRPRRKPISHRSASTAAVHLSLPCR